MLTGARSMRAGGPTVMFLNFPNVIMNADQPEVPIPSEPEFPDQPFPEMPVTPYEPNLPIQPEFPHVSAQPEIPAEPGRNL